MYIYIYINVSIIYIYMYIHNIYKESYAETREHKDLSCTAVLVEEKKRNTWWRNWKCWECYRWKIIFYNCNGYSKMETRVEVMRWHILKETQQPADKTVLFIFFATEKHTVLQDATDFLTTAEKQRFSRISLQVIEHQLIGA